MESQAALLLTPSGSGPWLSQHRQHSPMVLLSCRIAPLAPSLFSRPSPSLSRLSSRISATLGDEDRWLREEQRWLREEQRWLREEARWHAERRLMAEELALLKREMEQLRAQVQERRTFSSGATTLPSVVASLKRLVQSLPTEPRPNIEFVEEVLEAPESISDLPSSSSLTSGSPKSASASFPRSPAIPSMSEFSIDLMAETPTEVASTWPKAMLKELRKGAEGDEVTEVQVALEELGFYSGEEDIEYSMFSDGTETAVKTWQASIGVREDGILCPDLLAILFGKSIPNPKAASHGGRPSEATQKAEQSSDPWKAPAAVPSTGSEISRKKTFAEDKRDVENTEEGGIAANRKVFLLGENRWEEPGRLVKPTTNGAATPLGLKSLEISLKCFSCKGEGVSMCTECEGTGELNVEDQFLDWMEEGAKCPYCEGSGAISCDVCEGLGAVPLNT